MNRVNPSAGSPQVVDSNGSPIYPGGGSQSDAFKTIRDITKLTPSADNKTYTYLGREHPMQTYSMSGMQQTQPATGNGQGAGTGSGGAYTFEDQARDRYGVKAAPSTGNGQGVGSVTSPPIQSGGLPFQNMGGNPFQNMGGNPLGFLNQNNLGGQNKYLPQLAQVIGNRLGYPQQGGGTKFERPSQPPQGIDGRGERGYPDGQGGFTTSWEPWQGGWDGTPQPQRGGNGGFDLGNIAGHAMEYLKDPSSLMKSRRPSGNTLGPGQSVEEQWQAHDNQLAADGKPNSYIVRRDGNNSAGVTYSIMGPDGIRRERYIS
jgi:hypothetical protein